VIIAICVFALIGSVLSIGMTLQWHDRMEDAHLDLVKRVKLLEQLAALRQQPVTLTTSTSTMADAPRKTSRKPRKVK